MSKRDSSLLVKDILVSVERILEYTERLDFEGFAADQRTIDAVVRNFEISRRSIEPNNKTIQDRQSGDSLARFERFSQSPYS
jgi:uncharacterized protein with HEPN domain